MAIQNFSDFCGAIKRAVLMAPHNLWCYKKPFCGVVKKTYIRHHSGAIMGGMTDKRGRPPISPFGAKRHVTFRLNPDMISWIAQFQRESGLTRVAIVEDALEDYIRARDPFMIEAMEKRAERLEVLLQAADRAIEGDPYDLRLALHRWRQG